MGAPSPIHWLLLIFGVAGVFLVAVTFFTDMFTGPKPPPLARAHVSGAAAEARDEPGGTHRVSVCPNSVSIWRGGEHVTSGRGVVRACYAQG